MNIEDLVTVRQAQKIIGVTRGRIYQLISDGKLKAAVKYPGKQFFLKTDVEDLKNSIRDPNGRGRPRSGDTEAAASAQG